MKISELFEAQQNKLILIDFQPAYSHVSHYDETFRKVCSFISKNNVQVLAFFNGYEYSEEDIDDVYQHYIDYGLTDEDMDKITFIEKGYAFLRSWMDMGVSDGDIIRTLKYMMIHHINDSRDIPEEELSKLVSNFDIQDLMSDCIYFNDVPIALLKKFSNALMGGGGRHECFKEMQLLMSAYNIRNKEVQDWIY